MTYVDLYLRADTESDLVAALSWARVEDEDGPRWSGGGDGYALHIIGPLVTTPGEYDDDGAETSPPVIDPRFHANLRCSAEVAATVPAEVIVTPEPSAPRVTWAG